jgi:hypothetical protein
VGLEFAKLSIVAAFCKRIQLDYLITFTPAPLPATHLKKYEEHG